MTSIEWFAELVAACNTVAEKIHEMVMEEIAPEFLEHAMDEEGVGHCFTFDGSGGLHKEKLLTRLGMFLREQREILEKAHDPAPAEEEVA